MENLAESFVESTHLALSAQVADVPSPTIESLLRKRIAELEATHAKELEEKDEMIRELSAYWRDEVMETRKEKEEVEKCQGEVKKLIMDNKMMEARVDTVMTVCGDIMSKKDELRDVKMQLILKSEMKNCENLVKDLCKKEKKSMNKTFSSSSSECGSDESESEPVKRVDEELEEVRAAIAELKEKQAAEMKRRAYLSRPVVNNNYVKMMILLAAAFSLLNILFLLFKKNQHPQS